MSRPDARLWGTAATATEPYLSLSGTSMASPVVAATVALMVQANPTLTPAAVKAILRGSAEPHDAESTLAQGAGFLDARAAVEVARSFAETPAAAELLDDLVEVFEVEEGLWTAPCDSTDIDCRYLTAACTEQPGCFEELGSEVAAVTASASETILWDRRTRQPLRRRRHQSKRTRAHDDGGSTRTRGMKSLPFLARAVRRLGHRPRRGTAHRCSSPWRRSRPHGCSCCCSRCRPLPLFSRSTCRSRAAARRCRCRTPWISPRCSFSVRTRRWWWRRRAPTVSARSAFKERNPIHRTLFSMACLVLTVQAAGRVYWLLDGVPGVFDWNTIAQPLVGAATTYFVVNTLAVASAIALSTRQSVLKVWNENFLWSAPSYFVGAGVAAVSAWMVVDHAHWLAVTADGAAVSHLPHLQGLPRTYRRRAAPRP